jgi:uncharacterized SAM-binding protein YcdF (DUF218 family)
MYSRLDHETVRFLRLYVWAVVCAMGAWGLVAFQLGESIYYYPRQTLTVDSGDVMADAIIVLGGGRDERPQRAAELYRAGDAPRVLVSGRGDCAPNVQLLEKNGVPANVITMEDTSDSTLENAQFSVPLLRRLGVHRAIIVTSWFHSRRALACFKHFGPDIQFYSRPSYLTYQPTPANRQDVDYYVADECVKILCYWVGYGVWPFYWQ